VPTLDFDGATTCATRQRVEAVVAANHATLWIQYNPATCDTLKKAPEYYQ
jgi:hypothetical protein